jgi:hypothetical protein
MPSTANMMRRMPSVFAGASFGSALIAFGLWNIANSIRPWPPGVRSIAMSCRTSSIPHHRRRSPRSVLIPHLVGWLVAPVITAYLPASRSPGSSWSTVTTPEPTSQDHEPCRRDTQGEGRGMKGNGGRNDSGHVKTHQMQIEELGCYRTTAGRHREQRSRFRLRDSLTEAQARDRHDRPKADHSDDTPRMSALVKPMEVRANSGKTLNEEPANPGTEQQHPCVMKNRSRPTEPRGSTNHQRSNQATNHGRPS